MTSIKIGSRIVSDITNDMFDFLLKDEGYSTLILEEYLRPAAGRGHVMFPPTYAKEEGNKEKEKSSYSISAFADGTNRCIIDSVGSQANRMELLWSHPQYQHLLPGSTIQLTAEISKPITQLSHRAGDVSLRCSNLKGKVTSAFAALATGNAELMAKDFPDSLVYGAWDSRGTHGKCPRIVSSEIHAYGVTLVRRSAQYTPTVPYKDLGLIPEPENDQEAETASKRGFNDIPSTAALGGITASSIRMDRAVRLSQIRRYFSSSMEGTLALQRYLLGLALVSVSHDTDLDLRQGCTLVRDMETSTPVSSRIETRRSGAQVVECEDLHLLALAYANIVAAEFGVGTPLRGVFDKKLAETDLEEDKKTKGKGKGKKKSEEE